MADNDRQLNPALDTIAAGDQLTFHDEGVDDRMLTAMVSMQVKKQLMFRARPGYVGPIDHPDAIESKERWIFSVDGGITWATLWKAIAMEWLV